MHTLSEFGGARTLGRSAVCTESARVVVRAHLEQSVVHAQLALSAVLAQSVGPVECTKSMKSTEFPQLWHPRSAHSMWGWWWAQSR